MTPDVDRRDKIYTVTMLVVTVILSIACSLCDWSSMFAWW